MQGVHARLATKRAQHALGGIAGNRDAHPGANPVGFGDRLEAQRIADNHAAVLELAQPILHRASRHPQALGDRRQRQAGIVAQQPDQLTVYIVHLVQIVIHVCRNAQFTLRSRLYSCCSLNRHASTMV